MLISKQDNVSRYYVTVSLNEKDEVCQIFADLVYSLVYCALM